MPLNSAWFSHYLSRTREQRHWSQQQVADAGGPYRQALAAIENRTESVLRSDVLQLIERAYGWPDSYAHALAELGEYVDDPNRALPDSLHGGERDRAAMASYPGRDSESTVSKTFSALYKPPGVIGVRDCAYMGFEVTSGDPLFLEGPTLTNVAFDHLHPMILARHGVTTIDVSVTGDAALKEVREYSYGQMPDGVARNHMKCYEVGGNVTESQAIALNPLSEITSLWEAKRLANELLAIRPHVRTTAMHAAFTFLAIVAFGDDPLVTLTQLKRGGSDTSALEFARRFDAFWNDFYDPAKAGPDLACPDPSAYDLLAGVLAARDAVMEVQLIGLQGQRMPRYHLPKVVSPERLTCDAQGGPTLIFYDSSVIPEFPAIQSIMRATEALTFHRVEFTGPRSTYIAPGADERPASRREMSPQFGEVPYYRIGIASSADDRDVVAQHQAGKLSTLTNFVPGLNGGQAIYCESGRARRVWIPQR